MSFLIIWRGLRPMMENTGQRVPLHLMWPSGSRKTQMRSNDCKVRKAFSHTQRRDERGYSGHMTSKWKTCRKGEKRSVPHEDLPPAPSAGGQLGKQIVHAGWRWAMCVSSFIRSTSLPKPPPPPFSFPSYPDQVAVLLGAFLQRPLLWWIQRDRGSGVSTAPAQWPQSK